MATSHGTHDAREITKLRLLLLSLGLGLAVSFLAYAWFLQTPVVSRARLALSLLLFVCVAFAHYLVSRAWVLGKPSARDSQAASCIAAGMILAGVFLPLLVKLPAYPQSPLLRPWTELAVQFALAPDSPPAIIPENDVKLAVAQETLNATAFVEVGGWERAGTSLRLDPGNTAALQWTDTAPEAVTLSIQPPAVDGTLTVYWDGLRSTVPLQSVNQKPIVITKKFVFPWGYGLAYSASLFFVCGWTLGVLAIALWRPAVRLFQVARPAVSSPWVAAVLALGLGALTVQLQVNSLQGGVDFLTTQQWVLHNDVLAGRAPNPWQYRVFPELVAELFVRLCRSLSSPNAIAFAFIALRLLQNVAIFLTGYALYRRIVSSSALALLGILILAGSMKNAFYDSDLSFSTYFDVLAYLLCARLLLSQHYWGVVVLTFFAAANRETSGLIPFMLAAAIWNGKPRPGFRHQIPFLLSLSIFAAIFLGLRLLFPERPPYIPYKHAPGFPLLLYNLSRQFTWSQLFRTLGLIPLLGLAGLPSWPRLWQRWLLVVCPIWFAVHALAGIMAETRLFLVPQALVFIPGTLFVLRGLSKRGERIVILRFRD